MKNCKVKTCKLPTHSKEILRVLYKNPSGLRVEIITQLTKIKQRTVYSNLDILKELRLIEHIYPVWRVCKSIGQSPEVAKLLEDKPMEAHAFSYVMRLVIKPDWWDKRGQWLKRYISKDVEKKKLSKGNTYFQYRHSNYLIQAFNDSMIFISQKKYFGEDAYDCYIQSVRDLISYYEDLETKLRFRFFLDGVPQVTLRGQNYNFLKDILAQKCKKSGNRFEIVLDGKRVLWVDFSDPLGVESDDPERMEYYQGFVTDVMKEKPIYVSEIVKKVEVVESNQNNYGQKIDALCNVVDKFSFSADNFANNFISHVRVIQGIDSTMQELKVTIKELTKVVKEKKDESPN